MEKRTGEARIRKGGVELAGLFLRNEFFLIPTFSVSWLKGNSVDTEQSRSYITHRFLSLNFSFGVFQVSLTKEWINELRS